MFTGIVQGFVASLPSPTNRGCGVCRSSSTASSSGLQTGASVAVNGTCLTATSIENGRVGFDVIRESVDRSNLGRLAVGDLVNVERSLKFGDEIGGHVLVRSRR